jgi:very-short-patch-repair endonuclease
MAKKGSKEWHENISKSLIGRLAWNKGLHSRTNTGRTHFKKGQIPVNKVGEDKYCLYCNKRFHEKPARLKEGKGKYCSRICFDSAVANPPKPHVCKQCGKSFIRVAAALGNYCSRECTDLGRHTAIIRKCGNINCNNQVYVFQSTLKSGGGKYCSRACFGYTQIPTSIEKIVYQYLEEKNIIFERQKSIAFYLLDVYIPSLNLVIEADGEYWHSLPDRIRLDKAKDGYLKNRGYKLIRLPESKILSGEFKKLLPF